MQARTFISKTKSFSLMPYFYDFHTLRSDDPTEQRESLYRLESTTKDSQLHCRFTGDFVSTTVFKSYWNSIES